MVRFYIYMQIYTFRCVCVNIQTRMYSRQIRANRSTDIDECRYIFAQCVLCRYRPYMCMCTELQVYYLYACMYMQLYKCKYVHAVYRVLLTFQHIVLPFKVGHIFRCFKININKFFLTDFQGRSLYNLFVYFYVRGDNYLTI